MCNTAWPAVSPILDRRGPFEPIYNFHLVLKHICMRAGGPFPLFHYKIGSCLSHYFAYTTILNGIKACLSLFLPFKLQSSTNGKFVPT